MNISALLTSAGINIGLCVLFLSLYSILRKQPGNAYVYFGRRLAQERSRLRDFATCDILMPSASWIMKAWEVSEEEILSLAGMDAVVFLRIFVFSIRVFSIAALVCVFGVLPVNYYGKKMQHQNIHLEPLDVFTIGNVKDGSQGLWVHCGALYIITCSACILLYFEYKAISEMRLVHINGAPPNPSQFSVLVRAVPESEEEPLTDTIRNFFTSYHGSSYLAHQLIYRTGKVQKIMSNAEKAYKKFVRLKVTTLGHRHRPAMYRCGLCGSSSFQLYHNSFELVEKKSMRATSEICRNQKECSAAFVFFKTRYAAIIAAKVLQSSNPMLWVIDQAPEPYDVYWSNLWLPYRQIWFRQIASVLASIGFMIAFLPPVAFIQGLTQLEILRQEFPFLKGTLEKNFINKVVSGYLPSVILQLFLYTVPPVMMILSALGGAISRSGRKNSACCKILCFNIWNIFFMNVFSGSIISRFDAISRPKDIPTELGQAVPKQATFFITYVLTLGWASLSSEVLQVYSLIYNFVRKHIFRCKDDPHAVPSFPYHTEVPKVLLFGLLGFTCSVLAPLILPFLLVYFLLGYVVYRNQILNVYSSKYETGGQIWPIVHNTTVFSLLLTHLIAAGVFTIKNSSIASILSFLLIILTLLFNEYCRKRFCIIFNNFSAQDLIDMDRKDEESGRIKEIHQQLLTSYCQFPSVSDAVDLCNDDVTVGK